MEETEESPGTEESSGTEEKPKPQPKTEVRLEMRLDPERYDRIKKMARYAAVEGIIPDDHRGNMTAWVNYCLNIGDELMTKRALKKRGFS